MYVAVDIGGTTCRVVGFSSLTDLAPVARQDFAMSRDYETDAPKLWESITKVAGSHRLQGIGVGTHGVVDPHGRTITDSGKLKRWHHHPITRDLETRFNCEVRLTNDAYSAAMSEAVYGEMEGKDFWFIIWGTGLGGSFVTHQRTQPMVFPSECGHQQLDPSAATIPDGCGQRGCMESLVSGGGIEQNMGKSAYTLTEKEWENVCELFARGLYNIMTIRPTAHIVIGGGVAIKQAHRLSVIEDNLHRQLHVVPAPQLSLVTHGEEAGLVGALALLRRHA